MMLSVMACATAAAEPPPGAGSARERSAIEAAARAWIAAFEAGDLEALMRLYEPDAFVALHGQPALRGIEAIRNYFAPRVGRGKVRFLLDIERIEVNGRMAHLISGYWFTLELPDRPLYQDAGRSLLIYKKTRSGAWRIYVDIDQGTPDVSFPPPPAAAGATAP
jgi:uncharacterized protein (TIGR02246 family)